VLVIVTTTILILLKIIVIIIVIIIITITEVKDYLSGLMWLQRPTLIKKLNQKIKLINDDDEKKNGDFDDLNIINIFIPCLQL
jgi:hypothetical protein